MSTNEAERRDQGRGQREKAVATCVNHRVTCVCVPRGTLDAEADNSMTLPYPAA
jgi:hypothetical protein